MIDTKWLGRFVTAKLVGVDDCRQGWVVELEPFVIEGESGTHYACEGEPVLVDNPPKQNPFKNLHTNKSPEPLA